MLALQRKCDAANPVPLGRRTRPKRLGAFRQPPLTLRQDARETKAPHAPRAGRNLGQVQASQSSHDGRSAAGAAPPRGYLTVKTLGLIGGISAESTAVYYQQLTRLVRERLGGLHSCELILWSVDFAAVAELQAREDWNATGAILADAARKLEAAGAQAIVICANTMHLNAPQVAAAVSVPLIHIADARKSVV